MKFILKKFKNKKGIALAEVIVCMAVVTIVSMLSMTIVNICVNQANYNYYYSEARNLSKNMMECFKSSGSDEDFTEAIEVLGFEFVKDCDDYVYQCKYYKLEVNVTFNTNRFGKCSYFAICYNAKGNLLFEQSFDKY